eukprot:1139768-Alexandrium_andersonii.AAC.1
MQLPGRAGHARQGAQQGSDAYRSNPIHVRRALPCHGAYRRRETRRGSEAARGQGQVPGPTRAPADRAARAPSA